MDWSESHYSQDTAMRLARSGALVIIACAPDACAVCRSRAGRVYTPSDVPRLPIRGCLNEQCRCHFVAVDPESKLTVPELVQQGAQVLKAGQAERARQILRRALALDEMYEQGWLWLSGAVEDDQEKIACMEKVLAINPRNQRAQAGLALLREKGAGGQPDQPAPARPAAQQAAAEPAPWPPAAIAARQERKVVQEQWAEFLGIAAQTDPELLTMQGLAFLKKVAELNDQALESLPPGMQLDELRRQWQESEAIGEALASLIHDAGQADTPGWPEMRQALGRLARELLAHRDALRAQIAAASEERIS